MLKNILIITALASALASTAMAEDKAPAVAAPEAKAATGEANADTLKAVVDAATIAKKAAASVGGEWRDIGKFLKKADALAKDGNFAKAEKLAKKAESQAKLGKAQMEGQSNLAFPAYFTK
jgi:opacity protein-like surface antigen